eukprot:360753-Chlamydomonas_euryale.AAC.1
MPCCSDPKIVVPDADALDVADICCRDVEDVDCVALKVVLAAVELELVSGDGLFVPAGAHARGRETWQVDRGGLVVLRGDGDGHNKSCTKEPFSLMPARSVVLHRLYCLANKAPTRGSGGSARSVQRRFAWHKGWSEGRWQPGLVQGHRWSGAVFPAVAGNWWVCTGRQENCLPVQCEVPTTCSVRCPQRVRCPRRAASDMI